MDVRGIMASTMLGAAAIWTGAAGQNPASEAGGAAVVKVVTEPVGAPGSFAFSGVPQGTTVSGGSLSQTDLAPGEYISIGSAAPGGLVLVGISCDDGDSATPSSTMIEGHQAIFNIDPGETVTCVFLYRTADAGQGSGSGAPVPGSTGTAPSVPEPGAPEPDEPGGSVPSASTEDCDAPALVPKAGTWDVTNFAGSMICGSMINMPLSPSRETGVLEVKDCGWTVIGNGMADDTVPLTMRAVDATSGRYAGSVGSVQDGMPMTINFNWQLNSDESIVGDLHSEVTKQGMTCRMSRSFELKYAGP